METGTLLERLYSLRDRLDSLDREEYESLNQDIHMAIWQATDNHQLKNFLMSMWNGPSVGHQHYRHSTFEHIDILQFIRDGKVQEAPNAMEQHIRRSMENILERYAKA